MTRWGLAPVAFAMLAASAQPASAQWLQINEQHYLPAEHNWEFRNRYRAADRLFNAFDYGHAILYERLYTRPAAPAAELEEREFGFLTGKVLVKPPRLPVEEGAIAIQYVKLVPEAMAMFEWAHVLHRQIYDVLADESLSEPEKDAEVAALLRYYKTRPDIAFSSRPKNMELMEGQYYSLAFREKFPKFNGLIWAYHWLQVGLYEPLVVGQNIGERQTGVISTVARFWQMIENAPAGMPRVMPMTATIAPAFAARYPEAAIIFDNLHGMHDVISDILASPEVPRDRKRAEILRAAERYRDATSFVMTVAEWRTMAEEMGVENMGGPAIGLLNAQPAPAVASPSSAEATRSVHELHGRLLEDSVIRSRMPADTGHHVHAQGADSATVQSLEHLLQLLADPEVERRVHANPRLHELWANPAVQACLSALRTLRAEGKPLPVACPARPAQAPAHRH